VYRLVAAKLIAVAAKNSNILQAAQASGLTTEKAQERLADSEIYQKHMLAKKYGIQIYNMFGVKK